MKILILIFCCMLLHARAFLILFLLYSHIDDAAIDCGGSAEGVSIEFIRCAARGCERHHRRGLFRVASLFTGLCSNIHACYLLHLMHNCDRTLATCVCFLLLHVSQLCISSHSRRKKRGEQGPHHLHTLAHPHMVLIYFCTTASVCDAQF